jgi:hypothetical protein
MLKFSVFQGFKAAQIKLHSDVSWGLPVITFILYVKGRTYLAKHILLQAIPKNELIGPKTGADDIKSDEFDRNNTGKSAG